MKRVVATGRTVDEAVTSALVRLGVTRSQATVRVIHEPVNRLFGILRAKEAEVEVTAMMSAEEMAREFLAETLVRMGIAAKIRTYVSNEHEEKEHVLEVACEEGELPTVIGRHGVTLDALQYLVNTVANRGQERYLRFRVDAGDYRRRRKEGLCQTADRAVERAVKTQRPVMLEVMAAAERKIIHMHLQDRPEVTTTSDGTEPHRRVVVLPVGNPQETDSRENAQLASGSAGDGATGV